MAHRNGLTGFNLDLESSGISDMASFLKTFTARLHAARPPVGVNYDAGAYLASLAALGSGVDRLTSMGTYTADVTSFRAQFSAGMAMVGSRFGLGLCPACGAYNVTAVEARFALIRKAPELRKIDLRCVADGLQGDTDWALFWPQLKAWLDRQLR